MTVLPATICSFRLPTRRRVTQSAMAYRLAWSAAGQAFSVQAPLVSGRVFGVILPSHREQLSALGQTHELFARGGIDYWLFGGWAVDFHAGSITRSHDDIDVAVWLDDHDRIARLLGAEGWKHAPEADEDGGTGYERDAVRLELTFLVRGDGGEVYIPLLEGRALWSDEPPDTDFAELSGVRARVLGLAALRNGKSRPRDDPVEAAKDRADFAILSQLG